MENVGGERTVGDLNLIGTAAALANATAESTAAAKEKNFMVVG